MLKKKSSFLTIIKTALISVLIGLLVFTGYKVYSTKVNRLETQIKLIQNESNEKLKQNASYIKGVEDYLNTVKKSEQIKQTINNSFNIEVMTIDKNYKSVSQEKLKIFKLELGTRETLNIDNTYINIIKLADINKIKIEVDGLKVIINVSNIDYIVDTFEKSDNTYTEEARWNVGTKYDANYVKGIKKAMLETAKEEMNNDLKNNKDGIKDKCRENLVNGLSKLLEVNGMDMSNINIE